MKFQQIRSATSVLSFGGVRFLIDPMLADVGAYPSVPFTTDTGRGNPDCMLPCAVDDLMNVDACIATHLHFDHFDAKAAQCLPKTLPIFCGSPAEANVLRSWGFECVKPLTEGKVEFNGVSMTRTPCEHGTYSRASRLLYNQLGISSDACGVIFRAETEAKTFYLVGDSVYCDKIAEVLERERPDVAAVNCAGAQAPLGHLIIMNQYDVLALMTEFPDLDVIATHVEGVSHATVNRPMLREFAAANSLKRLAIPEDGETLSY